MIKTAKNCNFMYTLPGNVGILKVQVIITETKFKGEKPEFDIQVTSIKRDQEDLLPILEALSATFQIKRLILSRAEKLFKSEHKIDSLMNYGGIT